MIERDEGGKFLPGTVANPGGRPKIPEVVRSRIQGLTLRAVDRIAKLLDSDDERIRLEAAKVVLDRAYGRPAQSTELKIEAGDVMARHLAALLNRAQAPGGFVAPARLQVEPDRLMDDLGPEAIFTEARCAIGRRAASHLLSLDNFWSMTWSLSKMSAIATESSESAFAT